jgi:hypothetical protein
LRVDRLLKGYYFATAYVNYGWHQDFDVIAQDLVNYLNVYIPIVKPLREKSNLSVIPFDALAAQSGTACRRLKGGCAHVLSPLGDGRPGLRVLDTRDGSTFELDVPVDLQQVAVTPELAAGDLLLVRADVIHRTQDASTERIAISIRAVNGASTLCHETLMQCGSLVERQRAEAEPLLACFAEHGTTQVTMDQFLRFLRRADRAKTPRRGADTARPAARQDGVGSEYR